MATNESLNQFGSILKDLLDIGGKGIKEGVSDKQEVDESQAKELMKGLGKITDLSPVALLGKLLGTASAVPDIQNARQESQRVNQMAEERKEPEVVEDPITKARKAPALKLIGQQSEQMLKSGTTPEQLIANADEANQKQQSQNPQSEPGQLEKALGGQPEDQEKKLGLLGKLSEMFKTGMEAGHGAVDPNYVTRQLQKQELEQGGQAGLEQQKSINTVALENFKQNRLDQREILKSQLKDGGMGGGAAMLGGEISDLIAAYDDVTLKGPYGMSLLGGVAAGVGFERDKRATFESFGGSLSWKFAEHILGQKGRAFTENERADVEKRIVGASLGKTRGEFKAKMNAMIKMANKRIPEGGEMIPNFDDIVTGMKETGKQPARKSVQAGAVDSGYKFKGGDPADQNNWEKI